MHRTSFRWLGLENPGNHNIMGRFCEALGQRLFMPESIWIEKETAQPIRNLAYDTWYPVDLVDTIEGKAHECKAYRLDYAHVGLIDGQIEQYKELQRDHPEYDVSFSFYRHTFPGVKKFEGTIDQMFGGSEHSPALSKSLDHVIKLPFSVILQLWDQPYGHQDEYVRRYENPGNGEYVNPQGGHYFPDVTCVKRKIFQELYEDVPSALESMGLDPDEYQWEWGTVQRMSLGGYRLNTFDVLEVTDLNDEWYNNFCDNYYPGHVHASAELDDALPV